MNNGSIVTKIGNKQEIFRDRDTCPKSFCKLLEDILSVDYSELSRDGKTARMSFLGCDNNIYLQLNIEEGKSTLSDESKVITLVRVFENKLKAYANFGLNSDVDFINSSDDVYSFGKNGNSVQSIKNFCNSWKVKKGEIGATIILVDDYKVFKELVEDEYFNSCYVLYSE